MSYSGANWSSAVYVCAETGVVVFKICLVCLEHLVFMIIKLNHFD